MKKNLTFKNAVLMVSLVMAGISAQAQYTAPDDTGQINKQSPATLGKVGTGLNDGGSVRVVDNKGTIKYLQVQNGITQITSKSPAGGIITTWQLGGKLTDSTFVDVAGKAFALDGLKLVPSSLAPSKDAKDKSIHGATGLDASSGYTFLVRDEKTGETLKLKPSDLVKSGVTNYVLKTGEATANFIYGPPVGTNGSIVANAAFLPSDISKVSVYRNGVKLLAIDDYTVNAGATQNDSSTLTVKATGGAKDPDDYNLLEGDRIEIQWIN